MLKVYMFLPVLILLCCSSVSAKEQVTVTGIIDGDSIEILYQDKNRNVRLIGIDTPESVANKKAKRDSEYSNIYIGNIIVMGQKATVFTESPVKSGDIVNIEFDTNRIDRYGKLHCYVWLENGLMLNEEIIKAGYAIPTTIKPNIKYQERFESSYKPAKKNRVGLWMD
ncbi:MAG: thermonuclease family protein [Candidatus Anammoxibacter sp.]